MHLLERLRNIFSASCLAALILFSQLQLTKFFPLPLLKILKPENF